MRSGVKPLSILLALLMSQAAQAKVYFEVGTGLGSFKGADSFFQTSVSSKQGFSGSFSAYFPVTRTSRLAHLDLGFQSRLTSATSSTGSSLGMGSANLGLRVEFWRFYLGGGYSPISFSSTNGSGLLGLHPYPSKSSYFAEGGAIWKVIPEFQIVAALSLEYGLGSGASSPAPLTEYGLRFRFPLNPTEGSTSSGVEFDGFRYPFGLMR